MHDSIAFKVGNVPVMRHFPHQGVGIGPQIPYGQRFKQETEGIEVRQKVLRA